MFKVGDIIVNEVSKLGTIISIEQGYITIYWIDEQTWCYQSEYIENHLIRPNIWSHHEN